MADALSDEGEAFETPPQPPPAKRVGSRVRMDPEYAAALRRLCEPPAPPAGPAGPDEPSRPVAAHAAERFRWAEQHRMLAQRELLASRAVLPHDLSDELAAELAPVLQLAKERAAERAAERSAGAREASALREGVREARELMQRASASPSCLPALRVAMTRVEERLSRAHAERARALAALARSEAELSSELAAHEASMEAWPALPPRWAAGAPRAARPGTAPARPAARAATPPAGRAWASAVDVGLAAGSAAEARDRPELGEAIARLDAQLDRLGGAACGWPEEEHALFLRVRAQLGGPPLGSERLMRALELRLPCASSAELRAHADVLARREVLLDEKRLAVAAWRAARETTDSRRAQLERAIDEERAQREGAERRRVAASAARARSARDAELLRWKEHKAAELAAAEASEAHAEAELRRRREREARGAARLRADVEAHAARREEQRALLQSLADERAAGAAAGARRANADELRRLRERDQGLVAHALERKHACERREAKRRERAELLKRKVKARNAGAGRRRGRHGPHGIRRGFGRAASVRFPSDPFTRPTRHAQGTSSTPRGVERDTERLLAPTATIERRREEDQEARRAPKSRLMTFGGERGAPPARRAVPAWRAGL